MTLYSTPYSMLKLRFFSFYTRYMYGIDNDHVCSVEYRDPSVDVLYDKRKQNILQWTLYRVH